MSETVRSIEDIELALATIGNTTMPATFDKEDMEIMEDVIKELAALRGWKDKTKPLMQVLQENDWRDRDSYCLGCGAYRDFSHADDCPVLPASTLL